MNLTEMIGELSPSAQRAVLRYTASLHMMESLCVPGQGEAANCVPDPRRMPGSIDAAGTLRLILLKSKDAEHVRRRAHREIVAMAHSAGRASDRTAHRIAGDVPPREGCVASEGGAQCGMPVLARGMCAKHYRRTERRRKTRRNR